MSAPAVLAAAQRAHGAGRLAEAETGYRQVLAAVPDHAEAWHYLGLVLHQRQRHDDALAAYARAAAYAPRRADTHVLRAMLLRDLGRAADGLAAVAQALALQPRDAVALSLRGALQLALADTHAAEVSLRQAVAFEPGLADAWHHLAIALHRRQQWDEAIAAYRRAAALGAGGYHLHYNLALAAEAAGQLDAAAQAFEHALQMAPDNASGWARLGNVQALRCEFAASDAAFARLDTLLQRHDDTPDAVIEPFVLLYAPLSPAARTEALRRYVAQVERQAAALPRPVRRAREAGGPLRVGYLSPDLGEHAVGSLVRDLFAAHDPAVVVATVYSLREHAGPTADTIRATAPRYRDVGALATDAIAAAIADDGIDILVDLAGYTLGARPAVLALRPAPLQIGWLGFLHTSGAPFLDGIVLDDVLAPADQYALYREPVLALPGTAFPATAPEAWIARPRAAFGLPDDRFLFASFNNSYKLDAALLDAWLQIHRALRDARFAVFVPPPAQPGLARAWTSRGGDPDALLWLPKLPMADHLARAAGMDLALDAFRYHAGATALGNLAAGLPTLCLAGEGAARRSGASLNRFLGLDALVTDTPAAYVDAALALARNPDRLSALRVQQARAIAERGLFDPARTARGLEGLYRALSAPSVG